MRRSRIAFITLALSAALSATAVGSVEAHSGRGSTHARANAPASLTTDIMAARLATAKYATSLTRARAAGYQIITRMIPDMGYHFLNPTVKGFDVRRPPILVYEHHGSTWQLGALE